MKRFGLISILIFFLSLLVYSSVFAQESGVTDNLSFDFGITRGKNVNIWPLFKKYRDSDKNELQIIYPFYSRYTYFNPRVKHLQFAPFVTSDSSEASIDKRYVTLYYPSIYHYQRQVVDSSFVKSYKFIELAPYITLFGISHSPNGMFVENNLLFFIWFRRNEFRHESRLTVFPLYWYSADVYATSHNLFPLYYQKKAKDSKKINIALLYSYKKDNDRTKYSLFPILWHKNSSYQNKITTCVFPLYWAKHTKYMNNKVLFPLWFSLKSDQYKSLTVLPLFSAGHSPSKERNHLELLEIYWHFKSPEKLSNVVFPVWWSKRHFLSNDTIYSKTLFPLFWSVRGNQKENTVLFPVIYKVRDNEKRSLTVFPFYSKRFSVDSSFNYFAITPLYWHITEPQITRDILFPLYWSTKSKCKNNKILFPFVFSLKDTSYQSLTVLPLFSSGHSLGKTDTHFGIMPVYWHSKSAIERYDVVFPLWWSHKDYQPNDTVVKQTFFPIYWSVRSKDSIADVVFPLVYKFKNPKQQSLTVFPFYASGITADSLFRYKAITPLFWKVNKGDDATKVLFPVYWSSQGKYYNNKIVFPLIYSFKDTISQSLTVAPLFSKGHSIDSSQQYFELLQIYWHFKSKSTDRHVVFPFWWDNKMMLSNDTISNKTLFPIYWSSENSVRNNKILFPLVYNLKNKNRKSFSIFPIYSYTQSSDSTRKLLGITPFYWHLHDDNVKRDVVIPIVWSKRVFYPNDTLSKFTIFPIYWSKRDMVTNNKVVFPLIYSLRDNYYKSFTFFPFFSTGHSVRNGRGYTLFTPLGGYFRDGIERRTYFFPIFHVKKDGVKTKSTVLWFIYRKIKTDTFSKTSLLYPLIDRAKTERSKTFRIAPVVWYSKTDSSRMSSVQPLYYSYKSNTRNTFVFSWFLYKHQTNYNSSTSNSVLWRLFYKENYLNGDYETRFLHLVYANIQKQGRREFSIFPLYHNVEEANGDRSKSTFFGFYNSFKQYIPEIDESYQEERVFWVMRYRSNYAKLKSEGKGQYLKRK